MPGKPLLKDAGVLYGKPVVEMFHEYIVSDTFRSLSRQEMVGVYNGINALRTNELHEDKKTPVLFMENFVQKL